MILVGASVAVFVVMYADLWRRSRPTPSPAAPRYIGWAIDGCGRPRTLLRLGRYDPVALIPDAWDRWQAALDRAARHQIGATP